MDTNFTLTVESTTKITFDFNNVVKMESQYQIDEGDAYILQFKNGASLFIAKDDNDYWYYQTDPTEDIQRGDIISPQPEKFDEIVEYIKTKSTYEELEDQVVNGVKIINFANQVWTVVN